MENALELTNIFRFSGLVRTVVFLYIFCVPLVLLNGQAKDFSDKDIEKINEADELKNKAEEQQLKTNDLYQEVSVLKQASDFDENKKLQSKHNELEKKIWKSEQETAELYGRSNKIKWDIYKKYNKEFWKEFTGDENELINAKLIEEKGSEFLYRGASERESAKRIKNPEEAVQKLKEAYELELMGLEKVRLAYKIYREWPDIPDVENTTVYEEQIKDPSYGFYETTPYSPSSGTSNSFEDSLTDSSDFSFENKDFHNNNLSGPNSSTSNVQLNHEQIMRFQDYLETHREDSITVLQNYISGYDIESVRQFWALYQSMELSDDNSIRFAERFGIENETELIPEETNNILTEQTNGLYDEYEKTGYGTTNENEMEIGIVSQDINTGDNADIVYRIQIAKNKTPLSQGLLIKVYNGNYDIGMINEDGWYKYSIGDFQTYGDADKFRNSLNIEEAFVVAYRDAVKFKDIKQSTSEIALEPEKETISSTRLPEKDKGTYIPPLYTGDNDNVLFIVQVAASRNPLTKSQLNKIYPGENIVLLREEEDWYKYQTGHSYSYEEAKEVLNTVKVRGAFIAAYKNGIKLKLWEAIRLSHEAQNEVVFMLQIAASENPLSMMEQAKLYNRIEKIHQIYYKGSYKYLIEAGTDYESARRAMNLSGIKGAFVVATRNEEIIDLKQAIELTK